MLNALREPEHIFIQSPTMMLISCLSSQPEAVLQAVLLTDKAQGMYCTHQYLQHHADFISSHEYMCMYIHIYFVVFVHCTSIGNSQGKNCSLIQQLISDSALMHSNSSPYTAVSSCYFICMYIT